jgi:hypothetical protein
MLLTGRTNTYRPCTNLSVPVVPVHCEYEEDPPEAIVSAAHSCLHFFGICKMLLFLANSSVRSQVQNALFCIDDVEIEFTFPTSIAMYVA